MKIEFIDVRRAYFQANAIREVYVELPEEDYEEGMCGTLVRAMYGTRDAAHNWEYEHGRWLESIGFRAGKASPCTFWHGEMRVRMVAHGDDFTVLGHRTDLDWFRQEIIKRYEVKFRGRLGPEAEDDKAIRILNRLVL